MSRRLPTDAASRVDDIARERMSQNLGMVARHALKHGRAEARIDAKASWDTMPRLFERASQWWFYEQSPRPRITRWLRMTTMLTPKGLVVEITRRGPNERR